MAGKQNGPDWAEDGARRAKTGDVGQEPCPKSGPAHPCVCVMEGGSVHPPLSSCVTHQDSAVIGSLCLIRGHIGLQFAGTQVCEVRMACWQQ